MFKKIFGMGKEDRRDSQQSQDSFQAGIQRASNTDNSVLPRLIASGNSHFDRLSMTQYFMSRPEIKNSTPSQLEKNLFLRTVGPKLVSDAYQIYRQSAQPANNLPNTRRQYAMLEAVCNNVPPGISLSVQELNVPLTQSILARVLSDDGYAIELQRTEDKNRTEFSENQTGRLSIKLDPNQYETAMCVVGSIVAENRNSVSHAKLMNPRIIGHGPEDAVIYMDNPSAVQPIVAKLKQAGVCRPSSNGILFMTLLAPGIYQTELPREAYATSPTRDEGIFSAFSGNGSVGRYNALLCVAAAIETRSSNCSAEQALNLVLS